MAIVAGVDFGTLSVRVAIVDSERGRLGSAIAEYPLHRTKDDPDYATQSHADRRVSAFVRLGRLIPIGRRAMAQAPHVRCER